MANGRLLRNCVGSSLAVSLALSWLTSAPARAEAPAASAPRVQNPDSSAPEGAEGPEPVPEVAAPPSAAAADEPKAKADKPLMPAITVNAWLNATTRLQSFKRPEKLNKVTQDAVVYLLLTGKITERIELSANFYASFGPKSGNSIDGTVGILDLNARLNVADPFQLWIGRMLVPSDRANFTGPWFMAPQIYPGFFQSQGLGAPFGPKQGPQGRNDGATLWGDFGQGRFKYYVGAFDLYHSATKPLISGRLALALRDKEPGFFHSATYYGAKDILSLGVGAQYKKEGAGQAGVRIGDYALVNGDVLFEQNFGRAGVLDIEGAYYKYFGPATPDMQYFALISWLTPGQVGPGKLQPLVRIQQLFLRDDKTSTVLDAQLGYVIQNYACRFNLGYQRNRIEGVDGNAMYFGLQLQK